MISMGAAKPEIIVFHHYCDPVVVVDKNSIERSVSGITNNLKPARLSPCCMLACRGDAL